MPEPEPTMVSDSDEELSDEFSRDGEGVNFVVPDAALLPSADDGLMEKG